MTAAEPYVPDSGLRRRLVRLRARSFARRPMRIRPERSIVSFTFDDFPRSAAEAGRECLEAKGWRGTYFASGAYAGQNTHLGPMFVADDLRELAAAGHEIGCHTLSHRDSVGLSSDQLGSEVKRNADALRLLGLSALSPVFSFPYGEASPRAKRRLIRCFRALRSVRPGVNRDGADRAFLRAVGIDGGPDGIARAIGWVRDAARAPGWLIFYAHDVREQPSPWGCTRDDLTRVLDSVARAGLKVLPMAAALDVLEPDGVSHART